MTNRPPVYDPTRGRRWLALVIALGVVLLLAMILFLAKLLPPIGFLIAFVLFAGAAVLAVVDVSWPLFQTAEPEAPEHTPILTREIWRDKTAPEELVEVTQEESPSGVVVIQRIQGVARNTHRKPFAVAGDELRRRFERLGCHCCGEVVGQVHRRACKYPSDSAVTVEHVTDSYEEPIIPDQIWVDQGDWGEQLKVLYIQDNGRVVVERIDGSCKEENPRPFGVEPEQLRAAFKLKSS